MERRQYDGKVVPTQNPSGRTLFWFAAVPIESVEPGTDRRAVSEGLVSLTPLRLDLTDHAGVEEVLRTSEAPAGAPVAAPAINQGEVSGAKITTLGPRSRWRDWA